MTSAAGAWARIVDLPTVSGPNGRLTAIEGARTIPFAVQRVYYFYDVPAGEQRGALAHRAVDLCVIAAAGTMSVTVDDGQERSAFLLDAPHHGLLIPRMLWLEITGLSVGAVGLVLASDLYDAADYVRDYQEFLRMRAIL